MATKTIDDYLRLPYTIEILQDEGEEYSGWFARVVELPGCMTQADTFEELGEMIEDAKRAWIEVAMEDDIPIPEPRQLEAYSGKFVVRVPKSLHRELVDAAERDGASLNQYINVALARSVSARNAPPVRGEQPGTWPGLSTDVLQVLQASGMEAKAEELDPRLFADWLEKQIAQVREASAAENDRKALTIMNELIESVSNFTP